MRQWVLCICVVAGLSGCAQTVDRLALRLGLVEPLPETASAPAVRAEIARQQTQQRAAVLDALARDDLEGAINGLRRYADSAPSTTPQTRAARGYLTLLQRENARRQALAAVQREVSLNAGGAAPPRADPLVIALLPFHLTTDAPGGTKPFNRALLAMIASDLAKAPGVRLLERQRIDALMREMRLSESALIDPDSAVRAGRLLGAGTVIIGSVFSGAPPDAKVYTGEGKYTLSATLADVSRGGVIGAQEAYGLQNEFFVLEKRVVHGILDILGVRDIPAAVDVVHTRNWDAYAQFTLGLKHLDDNRFEAARAAFEQALRFDPAFELAAEYHLATPARALSVDEIKAEAGRTLGAP